MIIQGKGASLQMLKLFSKILPRKTPHNVLAGNTIQYVGTTGVPVRGVKDNHVSLPKLPVPSLQGTLKKYLKSVRPLVTEEEFRITEDIVKTFGAPNGVGEKLQSSLEERARRLKNWLSEWWINIAYLDYRASLITGSSAGVVFSLQEAHTLEERLKYAALLIAGALDYKTMIENSVPEMSKEEDIDKKEYLKIFGTCRIPKINRDGIISYGQGPDSPMHIVVAHNNHFFKVIVYDKRGIPITVNDIYSRLKYCIEKSTNLALPVGILTTQHRDNWSQNYEDLSKDDCNKDIIADIQKSLFLVCIDGPINQTTGCRITDSVLQILHGSGASGNAGNRWYDKTIQFIIGENGSIGLTIEHAPIDGILLANIVNYSAKYLEEKTESIFVEKRKNSNFCVPKQLTFNVSSEIVESIEIAKESLESLVQNLEIKCFAFQDFGKIFIKENKLSPDSFIQMAIQLTFHRTHKEPCAQYESSSTGKFLHGRTETIRSCSVESVNFSETMLDPEATNSHKVAALKSAIEAHRQYAKDAVNGYGIDRHLLGLKITATELGMEVPKLFTDTSFIKSSHMIMSTSQVPTECNIYGCFAPVVLDGYGCSYSPRMESIYFGLSRFKSCDETNLDVFKKNLEKSLLEMRAILEQCN